MKPDIIILARHGEPDLSRRVRLNWRGYKYWWRLYDEAGLKPTQKAPKIIKTLAAQADLVIASTLPRAIETAEQACGGRVSRLEEVLVEAPLPPPNLGYFKFRPTTWGVVSRISWCLGFSGEGESRKEAKIRAKQAAQLLSDEAAGGKMIFVAAHGWFNRMIRPNLKQLGFEVVEDHGDLHWSYRRYERPNVSATEGGK
ncbi:MAG: histidine phosphatase family protein [Robiginitomaculum sp.]|nr:MAG: histidine phosphatase family protein [Robiginitomaculum sp.]